MSGTPYDGKIYLWHWKGSGLAEQTIEDVVRTIKQWAPQVKGVFVKTSDGSDWLGRYDPQPNLAINGPDDIMRWVKVLNANGLEFHAWAVPKGEQIEAEADIIVAASTIPGVKSMILDVEPYPGFWLAGKDNIRPFMTRVRRGVGGDFHLGMSVDPRRNHYDSIYPSEWRPFINSVLPQMYWALFERDLREVLDETYATWSSFGLPIVPVLQGNAPTPEMIEARDYVIAKYRAQALSWWRFGVIGSQQFPVINEPLQAQPPPDTDPAPIGGRYGLEIVVTPEDPRFVIGTHTGQAADTLFQTFPGTWGWKTYYKATRADRSQVWARWDPQLTESGWYEVAVFTPARHANTNNARYKLHGALNQPNELTIPIKQGNYYNLWVPLGIYQFDANNPIAGVVFLNDLTGESDRAIAFDAVRYRQILGRTPDTKFLADGYDSPIGTSSERRSNKVWPGFWFDATGYGQLYFQGTPNEAYHTGADLNLNQPYFDADAHTPVYSAASGVVTFAGRLSAWGNVIVIRHDPLVTTGAIMYGRYAHVANSRVKVGDRVLRGQQIANVGNAEGLFPFHLHFDLSPTSMLEKAPWDWPKMNLQRVFRDYTDPQIFVANNRPEKP